MKVRRRVSPGASRGKLVLLFRFRFFFSFDALLVTVVADFVSPALVLERRVVGVFRLNSAGCLLFRGLFCFRYTFAECRFELISIDPFCQLFDRRQFLCQSKFARRTRGNENRAMRLTDWLVRDLI